MLHRNAPIGIQETLTGGSMSSDVWSISFPDDLRYRGIDLVSGSFGQKIRLFLAVLLSMDPWVHWQVLARPQRYRDTNSSARAREAATRLDMK